MNYKQKIDLIFAIATLSLIIGTLLLCAFGMINERVYSYFMTFGAGMIFYRYIRGDA